MMVTAKKPVFTIRPSLLAACVRLTDGSFPAAAILLELVLRSKKPTLKDEKGSVGWIALSAEQWMTVTGCTRHRCNDGIRLLKDKKLIQYRRRKLNYRHRTTFAWFKLADNTTSAIAEIMAESGISAGATSAKVGVAEKSENTMSAISAVPEHLKDMNINQHENNKNVVITKNTTKAKFTKKQEEIAGKEEVYLEIIEAIYAEVTIFPEPYSVSNEARLNKMLQYLTNIIPKLEAYDLNKNLNAVKLLKLVICKWEWFQTIAYERFSNYGFGPVPQLWAIEKGLKAVPETLKFDYLRKRIIDGLPANLVAKEQRLWELFFDWVDRSAAEQEELINKEIASYLPKISPANMKLNAACKVEY